MSNTINLIDPFKNWLATTVEYAQPTIDSYFVTVKNFLNYLTAFQRVQLNEIDLDFLWKYIHIKRDGTPYASASINVRVAALNIFFSWAYENDYCRQHHIVDYKKARIQPKPLLKKKDEESNGVINLLSPAEQEKILSLKIADSFTDVRTRCFITLILACAVYAEEITTLPFADFHLEQGYLEIKGTGMRERKIKFNTNFCNDACQAWLKMRAQTLTGREQPLLFITQNSAPVSKLILRRNVTHYLHKTDITNKHCTPDMLRQTAISNMLREGQSLEEVQERTGIKTLGRLELYQKTAVKT